MSHLDLARTEVVASNPIAFPRTGFLSYSAKGFASVTVSPSVAYVHGGGMVRDLDPLSFIAKWGDMIVCDLTIGRNVEIIPERPLGMTERKAAK